MKRSLIVSTGVLISVFLLARQQIVFA